MAKYFYERNDLVNEVLKVLGVLAAGDTPEEEDFEYVDERIDGILEELSAIELVYIDDVEQIKLPVFPSLVDYVAHSCKTKFSVSAEKAMGLEKDAATALRKLKIMTRGRPTYEPLQVPHV